MIYLVMGSILLQIVTIKDSDLLSLIERAGADNIQLSLARSYQAHESTRLSVVHVHDD